MNDGSTPLTVYATEEERRIIKRFAADYNISITDALILGFQIMSEFAPFEVKERMVRVRRTRGDKYKPTRRYQNGKPVRH